MKTESHEKVVLYVLLTVINIIWGLNVVLSKFIQNKLPTFLVIFLRYFTAGILLLILLKAGEKANGEKVRLQKSDWIRLICIGIVSNFVTSSFFYLGVKNTSAINSSIIMAMSPPVLVLTAVLFGKEENAKRVWIGAIICLIGVLITVLSNGVKDAQIKFSIGDLFCIMMVIMDAGQSIVLKNAVNRYNPILVSAYSVLFGSIMYIPFALNEVIRYKISFDIQSILILIYSSVFSTTIAFYCWYTAVKKLGNSKTAPFINIRTFAAIIFSVLLLKESISQYQIFGLILILIGVYITTEKNVLTQTKSSEAQI